MKIRKYIKFLTLIILFSSCSENYILHKAVKGKIVSNDLAIKDVSIKYDSTDVLSPQNIKTDLSGFFILPKVEIRGYKEFISLQKETNVNLIITKSNYKTIKINLDKYNNDNDTIDVGIIYLIRQ